MGWENQLLVLSEDRARMPHRRAPRTALLGPGPQMAHLGLLHGNSSKDTPQECEGAGIVQLGLQATSKRMKVTPPRPHQPGLAQSSFGILMSKMTRWQLSLLRLSLDEGRERPPRNSLLQGRLTPGPRTAAASSLESQ